MAKCRYLTTATGITVEMLRYVWDVMTEIILRVSTQLEPESYFQRDAPAEVLPGLFLGNHHHAGSARSINQYRFDHIISVGHPPVANPFRVRGQLKSRHEFDVLDDADAYIFPLFSTTSALIEKHMVNGERTYVHCHRGRSRSATIIIAYLIRYHKMTMKDALKQTRSQRPMADPNSGFMRQLETWERLWVSRTGRMRGRRCVKEVQFP
jgi:hypothetical protein